MGSATHVGIAVIVERVEDSVLRTDKLLIIDSVSKIVDDFYKNKKSLIYEIKDKTEKWTYVQETNERCDVLGCHKPQHDERGLKSTCRRKNAP